jgi:hypothetical protein
MYDRGSILTGLAVLVVAGTLPFWWSATSGAQAPPPEIPLPQDHDACVADTQYMRDAHMELLDEWRDTVVRTGERTWTAPDGTAHEMSLSNTCLSCHGSREDFCSKCHDYVGVAPDCWNCHLDVKGGSL